MASIGLKLFRGVFVFIIVLGSNTTRGIASNAVAIIPQNRLYSSIWEPYFARRAPNAATVCVASRAEQRARALPLKFYQFASRSGCNTIL